MSRHGPLIQMRINRSSEGKYWKLSGKMYGEWLEIIILISKNKTDSEKRYVKVVDYFDNTHRYPITIPVFRIERLIREGVVVK